MSSQPVIVTVASAAYMPAACVLGDSIKLFCPDLNYNIGIIDRLSSSNVIEHRSFTLDEIFPEGIDGYLDSLKLFGFAMLCKAAILQLALKKYPQASTFIYIDSDCFVGANLMDAIKKFAGDIIITPHWSNSYSPPNLSKTRSLLRYGQFNAGFIAVRRGETADNFLRWWRQCIEHQCSSSELAPSYVDQGYLDVVPYAFSNVQILSSVGLNLGYWNLDNKKLVKTNSGWLLNNKDPLYLFHFSGFSAEQPDILSCFDRRVIATIDPGLAQFAIDYAYSISKYSNKQFKDSWIAQRAKNIERKKTKGIFILIRLFLLRLGWWLVKHLDPSALSVFVKK